MATEDSIPIHEGRPPEGAGDHLWIRLMVRKDRQPEDEQAESLFRDFAKALAKSDYGEEFVLSIYRVAPEKTRDLGPLPRIAYEPSVEGIEAVGRFLRNYTRDVSIPLAS